MWAFVYRTADNSTAAVRSIDGDRDALGQRRQGIAGHLDHLDAFLGQAVQMAPNRVKLRVGRDG
jgi:hypothetical protein